MHSKGPEALQIKRLHAFYEVCIAVTVPSIHFFFTSCFTDITIATFSARISQSRLPTALEVPCNLAQVN